MWTNKQDNRSRKCKFKGVDIDQRVPEISCGEGGSFTWKLRGEEVTLNNVKVQDITYVKRSVTELKTLRDEFNTTTRKEFLENLGKSHITKLLQIIKTAWLGRWESESCEQSSD